MKPKDEILNMSERELNDYKWSDDLDKKEENTDCSDCSYCSRCSDCSFCRNLKNGKYCICNVQFTQEEYKKKMKELKECDLK